MARYTELITLLVSKEQRKYLDTLSKETGKSIGSLIRELIDEQIRAGNEERVAVVLDKRDLKMLGDIYAETDIVDVSEMISLLITTFHALSRTGLWRLLRPMDEISRIVIEESEKS
jgi:predicted DNA-binding protein